MSGYFIAEPWFAVTTSLPPPDDTGFCIRDPKGAKASGVSGSIDTLRDGALMGDGIVHTNWRIEEEEQNALEELRFSRVEIIPVPRHVL
jgi:hypothetical protein